MVIFVMRRIRIMLVLWTVNRPFPRNLPWQSWATNYLLKNTNLFYFWYANCRWGTKMVNNARRCKYTCIILCKIVCIVYRLHALYKYVHLQREGECKLISKQLCGHIYIYIYTPYTYRERGRFQYISILFIMYSYTIYYVHTYLRQHNRP